MKSPTETETELKAGRLKLKKLNATIAERQQYLKDQEAAIEVAVDNFNNKLHELQADIAAADRAKDSALREVAELQDQQNVEHSAIVNLNKRLDDLQSLYDENVAKFKIELRELQTQITQAKLNKQHVLDETQEVLKRLAAEERNLQLREQVLESREKQPVA